MYICPASKEKFVGECRIVRCPAHLPTGYYDSGCFHILLRDSRQTDIPEISYAFKISRRRARKEILEGMQELHRLATLVQWLEEIKLDDLKNCKNCGNPNCRNPVRCQQRQHINKSIMQRYPFHIPPLQFAAADLWRLIMYRHKLEHKELYNDVLKLTDKQLTILHQMCRDVPNPVEKTHAKSATTTTTHRYSRSNKDDRGSR